MIKEELKIEEGIKPLVNALNSISYIRTVSSCEGHFEKGINAFNDRSYAEVIFDVNKENKKDLEGLILKILGGVRYNSNSRIQAVITDIHNRYFMNIGLQNNWVLKITPTFYINKNKELTRDYTDREIKKITDIIGIYLKEHPEHQKS